MNVPALITHPSVVSHETHEDSFVKSLRLTFENGYTASIIQGMYSYGGKDGLFEIGVMHEGLGLVYDTPVTSDVIGYLHSEEVPEILTQIAELPVRVQ